MKKLKIKIPFTSIELETKPSVIITIIGLITLSIVLGFDIDSTKEFLEMPVSDISVIDLTAVLMASLWISKP